MFQFEEPVQKILLGSGKNVHVHCGLATTQDGTQSNHQDFKQIMAPGITGPRIFKTFKACRKRLHSALHPQAQHAAGRIDSRASHNRQSHCQEFSKCDSPEGGAPVNIAIRLKLVYPQ
jgi:hypothetical protein